MAKKGPNKSKGDIIIPFSQEVEGKGGAVKIPEGDYKVKIKAVKPDSSQAGNPMIVVDFEILPGQKGKGKVLRDYITMTPKSLWKVRSLLEALGLDPPKKKDVKLNRKNLVGQELGVSVYDDEYTSGGKSRISSKISDYIDLETFEGSDEEDEEEEDVEEDEDEEEDDEDDDLEDLDEI